MAIDINKNLDTVEAYVEESHKALLNQESLSKQIHDIDAKFGSEGSDHKALNAEREKLVRAHGHGQTVLQNLIAGRKLLEESTARKAIDASNRGDDKPLQSVSDLIMTVANEGRSSARTADAAKAARDELVGRGFQVEAGNQGVQIMADAAGRTAGTGLIDYSNAATERTASFYAERRAAFGGARKMVTVLQTADGNADKYPNIDYTLMTAAARNEGATPAGQNPPGPANITLKPKSISSGPVEVTVESNRDIPAGTLIVAERGARRAVQKYVNDQVTTGTGDGNDDFQGLVQGAGDSGLSLSTATVTWQMLVRLTDAIDPAYLDEDHNGDLMLGDGVMQGRPGFMFHKTFETQVKLIRSSTEDVPLWSPDISGGFNHMILGYPYVINQSMPTMVQASGAGNEKKVCLFGDFSTYTLREVPSQTGLRVYSQDMSLQLANKIAVEARTEACGAYLSGFSTSGTSEAVQYLELAHS